nr:hypothetical protein [Bacteroidales bacterium]
TMKKLLITLAALVMVCAGAAGQGNLLKGLGQKALNKVENSAQKKVDKKVDQTVDKAVDKALEGIFGKKQETPKQQEPEATATAYDNEPEYTFAGALMYEDRDIDNFAEAKEEATVPIYTMQDLVKYRPAWPTGADIANREAFEKYAEKVQDYSLSAAALLTANMSMKALMALGQDNTVDKTVQSPKAQAIADELNKIMEERNGKVQTQSRSMADGLRAALAGKSVPNANSISGAMQSLKDQIVADWRKSPEYKKVNSLEESGKAKAVRVKEESAVIDTWNKAQLEKWVAALQQWEKDNCAAVARLVELDAQLEALPEKEKKSAEYKIAKSHANGLQTMVLQWAMVPSEIFKCPYVEYPRTEEDY